MATDTAILIAVSRDDATCGSVDFNTAGYAAVASAAGSSYESASGSVVWPAAAGSHTYTLCGSQEFGDVTLLTANIQGIFSVAGTTNVASATSATSSNPFNK